MKFSVLMSVYIKENPEYLKMALESLLNQTVIPNQIVIVKDGSLNSSLTSLIDGYVSEYPELFTIIPLEKNVGLGVALQKGLEACKYELVARMDSDDICVRERFEKQLNMFERDSDLDIAGSAIAEFDREVDNIISYRHTPMLHAQIVKFAKKRNPFNHMTVMFKKSTVLNAGGYQHFLWTEDYYLWVRMILKGAKCANYPECLVYARTGVEMFERRGGFKYAKTEFELQKEFLQKGFINRFEFFKNCLIRLMTRIIPNNLRKIVYLKIIRRKK